MALDYSAPLGILSRARDALGLAVRRRVFELFMLEFHPGPESRVADFGVTGHRDHPVHYFFEARYPHRERLTVLGRAAEAADWYPQTFPGMTFLECDLRNIPLPDRHFDFGLCNAVVEHAGTRAQQADLVREVCRVCRGVLFTTPNRAFPVELHTFLPFLHWLPPPAWRRAIRGLGFDSLSREENLNPLYAGEFLALFPPGRRNRLLRLGLPGLRTNLACLSTAP